MRGQIQRFKPLTWEQRFLLASLFILLVGMAGIGAWITAQIQDGVVHRTGETAAVYVDTAVAPHLQELAAQAEISAAQKQELDALLNNTPLGEQIFAFKVWNRDGRVLYANNPALVGQTFPIKPELAKALNGQVAAEISALDAAENVAERARGKPLLEIYSPVYRAGTNDLIAVAEFYQTLDELQADVAETVRQTWFIVGGITVIMYLLLFGFVRFASNTISRQQTELSAQVTRLQELLQKNAELDERVRRAAAQSAALNERVLRRISAELHDGPAQDLGLAQLKLDHVLEIVEAKQASGETCAEAPDLALVQNSLQHALQEIRAISSGMGVPQLNTLALTEIVARVVRTHERRTHTQVEVQMDALPAHAPLPVKIALYRVIQEALTNAYRHARGVGQRVEVAAQNNALWIRVSDAGPGINGHAADDDAEHLGIIGMRDRVESLGGTFRIESAAGAGTQIVAQLPIQT
jgi:signal transduction histidine kinase